MEIKQLKTVRFSQVVEVAGKPLPVTLWTAPEEDYDFSKAVHEQRVLTVIQRNVDAKADYGLVGFFKQPLATYLVFPKKIPYPSETKVIGIKYEQLAEPKVSGPIYKPKPQKHPGIPLREKASAQTHTEVDRSAAPSQRTTLKPESPKPQPPPPPTQFRFRAEVQLVTRQVVPIEVEARSATEAARLLKEKASELQPESTNTTVTRRISKPKRVNPKRDQA